MARHFHHVASSTTQYIPVFFIAWAIRPFQVDTVEYDRRYQLGFYYLKHLGLVLKGIAVEIIKR